MKGNSWYLKAFYNSTVYSVVIAILINTNCMAYFQSENDIPVNLNIPDKSWDSSRPDKVLDGVLKHVFKWH